MKFADAESIRFNRSSLSVKNVAAADAIDFYASRYTLEIRVLSTNYTFLPLTSTYDILNNVKHIQIAIFVFKISIYRQKQNTFVNANQKNITPCKTQSYRQTIPIYLSQKKAYN